MKKLLFIFLLSMGLQGLSFGQGAPEKYVLSGGELIFSFADQNEGFDNILRFSAFFHAQSWKVYDYGDLALFHGLSIRNVGFIIDDDATETRVKYRTYNLGIPVGVILDVTPGTAVYGGYELELPFNFKQKTFINENKEDKFNSWFSDRTPTLAHGIFVGFQFKEGANIKFKYYLNNFFNKDYRQVIDGVESFPYQNFDVNVFYFALTFNIFKDRELIIDDSWD
jgi:hypothetical protein